MCFILTIAVPSKSDDQIPKFFGRGFHTIPTANRSVLEALPAGYSARLVTSDGCSCRLYSRPQTDEPIDHTAHIRRKYAKRGWSAAKTARAIEQAMEHVSSDPPEPGLRSDVVDRLQRLCQAAGSVAIVVHFYSGDTESVRLTLKRTGPFDCTELPARGVELREDEVLIVVSPVHK